ncbi:MAG TPA: ATP-binding protein [Roseiflexaceae bacterium]|nr:ATP-binding protein [Roseiflexaceae bacterium]
MIILELKSLIFAVLLLLVLPAALWYLAHRPEETPPDLRALCEAMPFGVLICVGQRVLLRNSVARRMQEQLGDALARCLDADDETARNGLIAQPYPVRWWRTPLERGRALVVLSDGSDQQRLVQQQQVFVGQLAHELRTPLTALVAHAEIARNPRTAEPTRLASLETVRHETQRMARLMRDLLELHRLELAGDLPLRPTNLALVAEEAIGQIIPRAEERGLHISFEADAPLPPVLAHPDRMTQVFLNLLDNAAKYCAPGDRILVTLEARRDGVACAVRDSGPGIPAQALPRVTERLYRVRQDVEGNGIGLALVSEILRQHHSALHLDSATVGAQRGTTASWVLRVA